MTPQNHSYCLRFLRKLAALLQQCHPEACSQMATYNYEG